MATTVLAAACSSARPQTPAPAVASPPSATATPMPMDMQHATTVPPDIEFMHGMIAHHSQAIEMSALVPARTTNETIRILAERITIAQTDEIKRMQSWLAARGDTMMPMPHDHMLMPGMLSPEDIAKLRESTGTDFEQLFLRDMIRHHQGALTMVAQLFATPHGVRDPITFQMGTNIDADQRAEIARMQAMLSK